MNLSPLKIEILMHYHITPKGTKMENMESESFQVAIADLLSAGILKESSEYCLIEYCSLTNRGKKLVLMLLETPYPVENWVDPRSEK